jgi:tetratricopeptide (TPR) repeat protein
VTKESSPTAELTRTLVQPNQAHLYYGQFLSAQGRMDEAVIEHKRALELDPSSQWLSQGLCGMYWSSRDYDKSIQQCLKVAAMYPGVSMPHVVLSANFEEKKDYTKALEEYQRSLTLDGEPEVAAVMRRAYDADGWDGVLKKQVERYQSAKHYDPVWVAEAYASLGNKDKAFLWLNRAYEEHASLLFIKASPDLDNIRSDPRYADLLRRMGLPQ